MAISNRVLVIGLDGATWDVLNPMRQRGVMPHLDALLRQAAHGILRSTVPAVTSAAWTSFLTGCRPERHAILDSRYYDSAERRMKVNHSGRIRVPTVWHWLSDAGHPVVSINLPLTCPPPAVRGIVVSGIDAPHLDAALAGSGDFKRALLTEVPDYNIRIIWKARPRTLAVMTEAVGRFCAGFDSRVRAAELADQRVAWSALMVQFQNLDPFQHRAWPFLNVDQAGIADGPWNRAAEAVLHGLDAAVGRLLELADRRGAAVIVLSDHGFGPCAGKVRINRVLAQAGLLCPESSGSRLGYRLRRAGQRFRRWSFLRQTRDGRGSSLPRAVNANWPFDWARTAAFAPHQDGAAMVYLNSAARHDGHAALPTAEAADRALRQTLDALAAARHPETDQPLFPTVFSTAERYACDPIAAGLPDVIAVPAEGYWIRTKLDRSPAPVVVDPDLPGTHRPDGVIAIAGRGVRTGGGLFASIPDVAPTLLAMLGVSIPEVMEGRAIQAAFEVPLATEPRDCAASVATGSTGNFEYSDAERAAIERRLTDLGYLD